MYATFEEFVDTHSPSPKGDAGTAGRTRTPPRRVIGGSALELARDMATSVPTTAIEFDFDSSSAGKVGNSKDDMSLVYRRPQHHHRCRYRRSRRRADVGNPLLETISSIQQDPCESDDHDFGEHPESQYHATREHRLPGSRLYADPDKDSIGYAGSNSIDSGYKSSCPTPEPSDGLTYVAGPHDAGGSKRSSIASQGSQKPRIAMGTKVMNRHSAGGGGGGRDLDHMMYLRQSILSAMFRPRSASASSATPGPSTSPLPSRRPTMASCPSSRTHSPCSPAYNATRLATAEEDIDTLLYGPCSYVTMVEDKYQRSSVARVKKLREKCQVSSSSSSDSSLASPPQPGRFSEVAKCMLEIIEDLQKQQGSAEAADYHVYEEIMYEVAPGSRPVAAEPPPLPARPDALFKNRPKQRGNLYALFREPSSRRDLSQSLEQEFRTQHDEYGFRLPS